MAQVDGPYGDTATNVIINNPETTESHVYEGVPGINGGAVKPQDENVGHYQELLVKTQDDEDGQYQELLNKPQDGAIGQYQLLDEPSKIRQDAGKTTLGKDAVTNDGGINEDIYHDIPDNEYIYVIADGKQEVDKEPDDDEGLVQIYVKSVYGGVVHTDNDEGNGNQQNGWVDNDIYAKSDEDQLPKRQDYEGSQGAEGWVDNTIYVVTDK